MSTKYNSFTAPSKPTKVHEELSIVLLSGPNYKMRSYGPKQLLKLHCGKTLIEYQIHALQTIFPNTELILSVGEDADKVIKNRPPNLKIVENQLWQETNEVEYARLALNTTLSSRIIIINSDVFFDLEILKQIKSTDKSCLFYDDSGRLPDNEVGITVADKDFATIFSFKLPSKWCHIAQLVNDDIKIFKNICADKARKKQYLFEAFNAFLERRTIRAVRSLSTKTYRIETSRDLEKIKNEAKNIDS